MKPIFLFDIDGTLLQVKRSFLFDLIEDLLGSFQINTDSLKSRSFAGRTDKDIFSELIALNSSNKIDFDLIKSTYIERIQALLSPEHIDIIPGALEAVHYVQSEGYDVGLCTGNFKEVAFKKVEAVGLKNVFEFGGYGCNQKDRNLLPAEAHEDYLLVKGSIPMPDQYIIVGDTPKDIHCAKYFGARSIAVTTGGFTEKQLREHTPDLILRGLANPREWISKL